MRKLIALALVLCMTLAFSACGCKHDWEDATCTDPKTCSECGLTEGEKLGHDWLDPTCTDPKTCTQCGKERGDALGHEWIDATCTAPKTCSVCSATEGDPLSHDWLDATCTSVKTCSVCETTEGDVLPHTYTETVVTEAACDHQGEKRYTCESCSDSYTENFDHPVYSATEIYDLYENSVGEVLTYDKSGNEYAIGTCFVYSANGKLITNYHVIEGAYSAKVTLGGKEYTVNKVLAYDQAIDIAVIQISASDLPVSTLCDSTHKVGETVYAFGSSRGLTSTLSEGIITHSNREIDNVSYTQHDAAISGGNSGGPLINKYGEVIGINTWTVRDSQNLNFAINVSELDNLVYGTPMTMAQFYEKECNPFEDMKNFIIENGSYDYEDDYYYVLLDTSYLDDGTKLQRLAYYYPDDNEITLDMVIDSGDYWAYITIDSSLNGVYHWNYFDDYSEMEGTLYASTFTSDTLLSYSYTDITSSTAKTDTRELASAMLSIVCEYIYDDYADIGLTPSDLGFINF